MRKGDPNNFTFVIDHDPEHEDIVALSWPILRTILVCQSNERRDRNQLKTIKFVALNLIYDLIFRKTQQQIMIRTTIQPMLIKAHKNNDWAFYLAAYGGIPHHLAKLL